MNPTATFNGACSERSGSTMLTTSRGNSGFVGDFAGGAFYSGEKDADRSEAVIGGGKKGVASGVKLDIPTFYF